MPEDLLEYMEWGNGAGELGESVYGLKADFRPCVGDGMSCVTVAILSTDNNRTAPDLHCFNESWSRTL